MKRRHLTLLSALAAAGLALTACSSGSPSGTDEAPASGGSDAAAV